MQYGLVSIIIPVYQSKKYIRECVNSIIDQTYKNIEIILVDDGSNDGSEKICDELANNYDFIKVIHQTNKGVGAARNEGIRCSNGKYILFIDSDDYISKYTLSKTVELMEKTNSDIVFFDFKYINGKDTIDITSNLKEGIYEKDTLVYAFWKLFEKNITHNIGTKLYKSDLIKENKLYFYEEYNICEDISFCINAMRKCNKIYYIKDYMYFYNIHEQGSLMSSYKEGLFEAEKNLFTNIKDFLIENGSLDNYYNEFYESYMNIMFSVLTNSFIYNKDFKSVALKVFRDEEVMISKKYLNNLNIKKQILCNLIWMKNYRILKIVLNIYFKLKKRIV